MHEPTSGPSGVGIVCVSEALVTVPLPEPPPAVETWLSMKLTVGMVVFHVNCAAASVVQLPPAPGATSLRE